MGEGCGHGRPACTAWGVTRRDAIHLIVHHAQEKEGMIQRTRSELHCISLYKHRCLIPLLRKDKPTFQCMRTQALNGASTCKSYLSMGMRSRSACGPEARPDAASRYSHCGTCSSSSWSALRTSACGSTCMMQVANTQHQALGISILKAQNE